jgi:hypothetical protein
MNDLELSQKNENLPSKQERIKFETFHNERMKQIEDELINMEDLQENLQDSKKLYKQSITQSKQSKNSSGQLYTPTSDNQANVYDYLLQFKEKNNQLQLKLNDLTKFKIELDTKNKKISELEKSLSQHKIEIKRLHLKNEENLKQNQNWENSFREIKGKIIKLEEEKIKLNDEIDKWRVKYEDLEFKHDILKEKFKLNEDNILNLKKIQTEYENAQIDLKKELKLKEENLKKKYEEITQNVQNRLKDSEAENSKEKHNLQEKIKLLEKEISKQNEYIEELNEKIEELFTDNKRKEREINLIIEEKDNRINELELDFKAISNEANSHIVKLNENITEINEKIKQKEISFLGEIENLNLSLEEEKEKNLHLEKIIEDLKLKLKKKENVNEKNYSAGEQEKVNKASTRTSNNVNNNFNNQNEKTQIDPNYVKKLEYELNILKKILAEKQEEVDRLQHDMNRTLISLNNTDYIKNNMSNMKFGKSCEFAFTQNFENLREQNNFLQNEIKKKEEESEEIKRKFNQLRKYSKELEEVKEILEKSLMEMKYDLNKKNEEIYLLKTNYDKIIQEFQDKLDRVFI